MADNAEQTNPEISRLRIGNVYYELKDSKARTNIETLFGNIDTINARITASVNGRFKLVDKLPEQITSECLNVIYLVPNENKPGAYKEYLVVEKDTTENYAWEEIGDIDGAKLEGYATEDWVNKNAQNAIYEYPARVSNILDEPHETGDIIYVSSNANETDENNLLVYEFDGSKFNPVDHNTILNQDFYVYDVIDGEVSQVKTSDIIGKAIYSNHELIQNLQNSLSTLDVHAVKSINNIAAEDGNVTLTAEDISMSSEDNTSIKDAIDNISDNLNAEKIKMYDSESTETIADAIDSISDRLEVEGGTWVLDEEDVTKETLAWVPVSLKSIPKNGGE